MSLVTLRHDGEHPQVGRRFDITSEVVRPWVSDVIEVRAQGEGDLAQLFDLTYFGDYVSLWLAADAGVDPGPIDVLMWMKKRLSGAHNAQRRGRGPWTRQAVASAARPRRVCGCKSTPAAGKTTHVRQPLVAEHGAV